MTRLIAAEFRKLLTTRLWLWLLLTSLAWTAGYCALAIAVDNRPGGPGPALSGAAGQHALFAIGAGGAGPLAAILAAAGTTGEFRHRTTAATFLAEPRRARVITAKLIVYLLAGAAYALACVAVSLAVALPWLAARGTPVSLAAHENLAVLGAVIISVALFGITGAGARRAAWQRGHHHRGAAAVPVRRRAAPVPHQRAGFLDGLPAGRGR